MPMLRMKLVNPETESLLSCGTPTKEAVIVGMKMKARGTNCSSMMTAAPLKLIPRDNRFVDRYIPPAERSQPNAIMYFAGTLEVSNPTMRSEEHTSELQ